MVNVILYADDNSHYHAIFKNRNFNDARFKKGKKEESKRYREIIGINLDVVFRELKRNRVNIYRILNESPNGNDCRPLNAEELCIAYQNKKLAFSKIEKKIKKNIEHESPFPVIISHNPAVYRKPLGQMYGAITLETYIKLKNSGN